MASSPRQPRPQGLLLDDFQNGGSSVEDPGTQQNSRDRFVHGGWKAAKIKSERIWVRGLVIGEKQT